MNRMKLRRKYKVSTNGILIIIIISIIFLVIHSLIIFSKKSKLYLDEFAKSESVQIATMIINKAIEEEIDDKTLNDLVLVSKDNTGQIIDISYNTGKLNNILTKITNNIQSSIYEIEKGDVSKLNIDYYNEKDLLYYVSLGVIYDIPALVDVSPKIPFKVTFLGHVETSVETNIKEYGINNSMNELYIRVDMSVQVIFPFASKIVNVSKNIPVGVNIIQGKIPEYYGGLISHSSKIYSD